MLLNSTGGGQKCPGRKSVLGCLGLPTFYDLLIVLKGHCKHIYTTVVQNHRFSDKIFPAKTWQSWPGHFCPPPPRTIKEYFYKWL